MKKARYFWTMALAAVLVLGSQVLVPRALYAAGQNAQTDNNIQAELTNKLKKFKGVQAIVKNGEVDLEGTVKDFATKEEIDKTAHRVKNVLAVRNNLKIAGAGQMSDAQLQAACGEAKSLGLRTLVHAHSASSMKAATLAGCTSIEHGAYADDDVLDLMAQHGTYYDPNIGVVLQNYLENKPKYFGIGNYNAEGFAFMEKGVTIVRDTFQRALKHKDLKIIYGTDATAGAHGHNYREFIVRVRDGGQAPMAALISATSLSAESLNLGDQIGSLTPGMQADIVAFDGNPLEDPTAAGRAVFVMKAGTVYENLAPDAKN